MNDATENKVDITFIHLVINEIYVYTIWKV